MISVYAPFTSTRTYLWINNVLVGPVDYDSRVENASNFLSWKSTDDLFNQGTDLHLYNEKAVDHIKSTGHFQFNTDAYLATHYYESDVTNRWEDGMYLFTHLKTRSGTSASFSVPSAAFGVNCAAKNWYPTYDSFGRLISNSVVWTATSVAGDSINVISVSGMLESITEDAPPAISWITGYTRYTVPVTSLRENTIKDGKNYVESATYRYNSGERIHANIDLLSSQSYAGLSSLESLLPVYKSTSLVYCYVYKSNSPPALSGTQIIDLITDLVSMKFNSGPKLVPYNYGDLAMEAANNAKRIQTNVLGFLRDLRNPAELIPKLKNLKNLKGISGEYLRFDYGILPTIDDLKEIVSSMSKVTPMDKFGNNELFAGHRTNGYANDVSSELTQRIKILVEDEESYVQKLYQDLISWGVFPTLETIWDLIPYSFIIDWFLDVGGLLERVDSRLLFSSMNVVAVTSSSKLVTSCTIHEPRLSLFGTYEQVAYHRWVSDHCPLPPLTLQPTSGDFDHWIEGTALVLQRK